jgi:hypothetical protein
MSNDLISILVKDERVTVETARKRISRAISRSEKIIKINGVFKSKCSLLIYKFEDYVDYSESLLDGLKNNGQIYYHLIKMLEYHYGSLKKEDVYSFCSSPRANIKKHTNVDTVIQKLIGLDIIYEENGYVYLNSNYSLSTPNPKHSLAVEMVRRITLNQYVNLLSKTNFIAYNSVAFNNDVSGYTFCATAPSYLGNIGTPQRPAFVVINVLIGHDINKGDYIDPFIKKVNNLKAVNKNTKVIPILLHEYLPKPILDTLKSNGVITAFIDVVFSKEYSEAIKEFINLLTNSEALITKNIDEFIKIINKSVTVFVGNQNNIKGVLFEHCVALFYSIDGYRINIGKIIRDSSLKIHKEIDVFASKEHELVVCECKATKSMVDLPIIEKWLGDTIPQIRTWVTNNWNGDPKLIFEYWSISGFTEEAIAKLEEASSKTKKYTINYYNYSDMIRKGDKIQAKSFKDVLRKHYKELVPKEV